MLNLSNCCKGNATLPFDLTHTHYLNSNRSILLFQTWKTKQVNSLKFSTAAVGLDDKIQDKLNTLGWSPEKIQLSKIEKIEYNFQLSLHSFTNNNDIKITICTQISLDRWGALEALAQSLSGLIGVSVIVYIPAPQSTNQSKQYLNWLQQKVNKLKNDRPWINLQLGVLYANNFVPEGSQIDMETFLRPIEYNDMYPINTLRNLSIQQSTTDYILLTDADFVPVYLNQNDKNNDAYLTKIVEEHLDEKSLTMLVVPAFQVPLDIDLNSTNMNKQQLISVGQPFHCGKFRPIQSPLKYEKWVNDEFVTQIEYVEYYEPLGIVRKSLVPKYDERFRGYGLNKVQFAYHLNFLNCTFYVLPWHALVTRPHERSESWNQAFNVKNDNQHVVKIRSLYERFKLEFEFQQQLL
eukprot:TRINITY_DN7680_c0_g1_i4.p1 TRINITY_DN7680_c0_g1~~TRINITY_DN7680_c0_g1_i4.p1  ORF type:complete len:407 (+),score=27.42 TRINITY_DN7680_c0_g1_i4:244-1464(+)